MDLKRTSQFDSSVSVGVAKPQETARLRESSQEISNESVATAGPNFAETLQKLNSPQNLAALRSGMNAPSDALKFSNHAVERMQSRGINYSPDDLKKLNEAVSKAAAKGSKDTLVLLNESALIVSVKNNTVVTVMDKNALKENVFTNIDSTIVM